MKLTDIHLRDPFLYFHEPDHRYYMTGTQPKLWGFPMFSSIDLENWERLPDAFTAPDGFAVKPEFWAPEIHQWQDKFYLLGTITPPNHFRSTFIFVADHPCGPYQPLTGAPATPYGWQCLDGTLWIEDGTPWMVFCREWLQVHDGGMWTLPLSADLKQPAGRPVWLFDASEAPWVFPFRNVADESIRFPCYVTDGPFLYRDTDGTLLMLWASYGQKGYGQTIARSQSGSVQGPWVQNQEPIFAEDGGHGMIFTAPDGTLQLALHQPNNTNERPVFLPFKG